MEDVGVAPVPVIGPFSTVRSSDMKCTLLLYGSVFNICPLEVLLRRLTFGFPLWVATVHKSKFV